MSVTPMNAWMPPDALPPDDAREHHALESETNVVDPEVLAERRAHRAEQAERSAVRRAADAQMLAADLARERVRLEAERDAARAEAAAAREGADAVKAEARFMQSERDALRAECELLRSTAGRAEPAAPVAPEPAVHEHANGNGNGGSPVATPWVAGLRAELAVARSSAARPAPAIAPSAAPVAAVAPALARERGLVARRATDTPRLAAPAPPSEARIVDRAAPVTALALERERSGRLQAQLERAAAAEQAIREQAHERARRLEAQLDRAAVIERELREQVVALQRAVDERREAEQRIEGALRRLRGEFDAANRLTVLGPGLGRADVPTRSEPAPVEPAAPAAPAPAASMSIAQPTASPTAGFEEEEEVEEPEAVVSQPEAPSVDEPEAVAPGSEASTVEQPQAAATESEALADQPATVAAEPEPELAAPSVEPSLDTDRLNAARERLQATVPVDASESDDAPSPPTGPPSAWLPNALRALTREDPETVGRILAGMLPAQGLVTQRTLCYDLVLSGRCTAVDVGAEGTRIVARERPRGRGNVDFRVKTDAAGLARLLYGRRRLRRRARVRGSRRRLEELRRLATEPLTLRDLASVGATLDPALVFTLAALAIDPVDTYGHRFTVAHAALAGGPPDAWLRIQNGVAPAVLRARPGEQPIATIRCTRGALLPVLAGIAPPPGESAAAVDGDPEALDLIRTWIARVEFPRG
ncbi:MAG TPA: hypothetical protein VE972_09435 [Conexibacter sp.]|nr:hypothetical protein [Conexibacter sp.]